MRDGSLIQLVSVFFWLEFFRRKLERIYILQLTRSHLSVSFPLHPYFPLHPVVLIEGQAPRATPGDPGDRRPPGDLFLVAAEKKFLQKYSSNRVFLFGI